MEDDGFKICPFCKEKIRKEAVKCRFCGEWLEEIFQPKSESLTQNEIPPPTHHDESSQKASEDLGSQMAEKTNDQLLEMFRQPDDWLPETLNLARVELQRRGLEPPKIVPGESQKQSAPDGQKEKPPKFLFWTSIALLSITSLVWIIGLSMVHWGQMSPGQQGEETVNLLKFLFVPGIITWFTKGKSEKLLTFSVVFAVMTAIAAYYFLDARHKAQEKAAESNRLEVDNINSLQQFIQGGATGDIPEFKPTGDTDTDTFFQATRDFYAEYLQGWRTMRQELEALQETDIFADLVLTNKPTLESEIQKRIAGQQIVENFTTNAMPMLENLKVKYASLNLSEEFRQGVLKGIDRWIPQYRAMFAASINSQKADEDLLQFLDNNFQDYELKDGKILFGSIPTEQQYDALAKKVQDASVEAQEFQKRGMAAVEASKATLQQTSK
jgi:hypothetical protein